jgi:hypothetical protein
MTRNNFHISIRSSREIIFNETKQNRFDVSLELCLIVVKIKESSLWKSQENAASRGRNTP